jgi:hypothetical protein
MRGHGWKLTLKSLATVASISLATYLNAQDRIAPVLSADSYQAYERYETDEGPEAGVSYQEASVDAVDIPSAFEDNLSDVKPVSFHKTACDASSCCPTVCCLPKWAHRTGGFGEAIYLSAGNSDLIYANEQTGPVAAASPTGPLGISNIGEHLGFRAGFTIARSNCSSVVASYTRWDGATTSFLEATGTNVINSQVSHPSVATTGAASLDAVARQSASFQFADAYFRRVCRSNDCGAINWNGGLRYGNLEQGISVDQLISVATGTTNVTTEIDFNGFGILGGLDGERHSSSSGFLVYGRVLGSLLAGNWQADYRQTNQFGGGVIATRYEDFRVTPVVDSELGVGWQSSSGRLRVSAGYLFSTWFNAVTTRDYIQSVRTGQLLNLDDNLTFSGLALRTELRF